MSRPKTLAEDSIRATVRLSERDWEAFKSQAEAMGLNRSDLIRQIAQGKIPLGQLPNQEKLLMGKS
jgi:predicted DNA binding CopG/RHH family protein